MTPELFLALLAFTFAVFFSWAFRALPQEQWQIIAAVPKVKSRSGEWQGLNLTYYGFFQATSNVLAGVMMFVLLGSLGIPLIVIFGLIAMIFAVCWPSARLIARAVEKKAHTFTVGGAILVGVVVTPWLIQLINTLFSERSGDQIPIIPTLAAGAIAYAYGEGIGRVACISFGCCYGKSLAQISPHLRRVFHSASFKFAGATKKVAYEGNLEGVRVVPIQAITSVIVILIALAGSYLFLKSFFAAALIFTMVTSQVWRFLSEMLRADLRGHRRKISAYQVMALIMIAYVVLLSATLTQSSMLKTDIAAGISSLWNPAVLLFFQLLWLGIFLFTGRSMVTGSTLSFFVHRDRI